MKPLLEIEQLHVDFATSRGWLNAIADLTLSIGAGETVCLVGESGSGKTVASKAVMRLIEHENGVISGGGIRLNGVDIAVLPEERVRPLRGKRMAMVFQEPMAAFDPVFTVGSQIAETMLQHKRVTKREAWRAAAELLRRVGIPEPELRMKQYPGELSGGMLQRAMIAMALACEPELLIADEPTTALDVTVQAQILQLLKDLQAEYRMAILLITHDMGIAAQMADRIVVMYAGTVVEQATARQLFAQPYHPYTQGLLRSIATLEGSPDADGKLYSIAGSIPGLSELPSGCRFHPRCPYRTERCERDAPPLLEADGRLAACWHAGELAATAAKAGGSGLAVHGSASAAGKGAIVQSVASAARSGVAEQSIGSAAGSGLAAQSVASAAGNDPAAHSDASAVVNDPAAQSIGSVAGSGLAAQSIASAAGNGAAEQSPASAAGNGAAEQNISSAAGSDRTAQIGTSAAVYDPEQAEVSPGGPDVLFEARQLHKYYPLGKSWLHRPQGWVRAVDDVSLTIRRGEVFGLVGESGSGKSTLGRLLLQMERPTSGQVVFEGNDLTRLNRTQLREARKDMQIIFQDPYGSLSPRWKIGDIIAEPLEVHGLATGKEKRRRVEELLETVGLNPGWYDRYPHEFSGGQRQRIGIARALALRPKFILADEAVSALDVSVQAQIVNLLQELHRRLGLTMMFIAHGLQVVRHLSTRIGVMYLGRLVEIGPGDEVFRSPAHPYTKLLLSSVPVPDPFRERPRIELPGEIPSPANPPAGCRFHPRCPAATARCREQEPSLREVGPGRWTACHFPL